MGMCQRTKRYDTALYTVRYSKGHCVYVLLDMLTYPMGQLYAGYRHASSMNKLLDFIRNSYTAMSVPVLLTTNVSCPVYMFMYKILYF